MSAIFDLWTIYDHPRDDPDHVVVRRWELTAPKEAYVFETLEEARAFLRPKGLTCLNRFTNDDPVIVETWI